MYEIRGGSTNILCAADVKGEKEDEITPLDRGARARHVRGVRLIVRAIYGDVPFRDIVTGATKSSHQGCTDQTARAEYEYAQRRSSARVGSCDVINIRDTRCPDRWMS